MTTAGIGATGRVGSEIIRGLPARGDAVTVLVRDHGKARRAFGEPDGLQDPPRLCRHHARRGRGGPVARTVFPACSVSRFQRPASGH
jgi:nucleoside-diphosphate-sugar epimerase